MAEKKYTNLSNQIENYRINSKDIFDGTKEIIIEHENQEYRLRITGNGKLILTK